MEEFRSMGIKLTPQRLAILEFLKGNKNHPSAEEIYREVKQKYPMMSFATVYNTLEALKKKGNLIELTIDSARRRYDPDTGSHHHLICTRCRKIVDINTEFSINIPEADRASFEIEGKHVEFYGVCPYCKKKKKEE
ncbi:MAG: Fur family transcriptional regulator [Nitrospira bacterium SG8_35_4]|nr:MAG: Fur family transcriptional regulator [Nitrospira bacterium SG8_35_4]